MDADAIMSEIYTRGPVAAVINAEPIVDYKGGIFTDTSFSQESNHIVSIVGWGKDEESGKQHWISKFLQLFVVLVVVIVIIVICRISSFGR